jgi:hypothetical protein
MIRSKILIATVFDMQRGWNCNWYIPRVSVLRFWLLKWPRINSFFLSEYLLKCVSSWVMTFKWMLNPSLSQKSSSLPASKCPNIVWMKCETMCKSTWWPIISAVYTAQKLFSCNSKLRSHWVIQANQRLWASYNSFRWLLRSIFFLKMVKINWVWAWIQSTFLFWLIDFLILTIIPIDNVNFQPITPRIVTFPCLRLSFGPWRWHSLWNRVIVLIVNCLSVSLF